MSASSPIGFLKVVSLIVAVFFCSASIHAQLKVPSVHEPERPFSVTTNNGIVTERYGTPNNLVTIQYDAETNDVPMVQTVSTNHFSGQVFDCLLMTSQLKNAPKWESEKAAPPVSPNQARSIAIEQAQKDMGQTWFVTDLSLVQFWGRWDYQYVWCYKVGVKRQVNGSSPGIPDAMIYITMDGKAAPYIVRKSKAKKEQ